MSNHEPLYRIHSADGKTVVTDLKTGQDITSRCMRAEFVHDADDGHPRLMLTVIDWNPVFECNGMASDADAPAPLGTCMRADQ